MLSINPDAHSISELDLVKWGVAVARKGGVPKDRVLNALPLERLTTLLRKRRQSASRARKRWPHMPSRTPRPAPPFQD